MAGPTKPELLTFFRAFGRWLDAPDEPAALARLVTLHDAIREAGEARPRVGRPAHLRGAVTVKTIIITDITEEYDGTEEPRPAPVDDVHAVRRDPGAGDDHLLVQSPGDVDA